MSTGVVVWSKTAASNDVIDAAAQFAEGQAPSSLNDGIRGAMSSVAKWRDDIAGVLVTAGSGTAYTLTTNQIFASNGDGYTVQFIPGSTNTGAVTLAVDGNTAKPLRFLTGTDLPAGVLISGSLYQATYRLATTEWLLHSSPLAQPFIVPLGALIDYTGLTSPSANFILPQGQAISRTVYAAYFSLVSTTYGGGDGSTTFNVIDLVGRVAAMRDAGSARLSSTYFGSNPATLGNSGGVESSTLTLAQIPAHAHANTLFDPGHSHNFGLVSDAAGGSGVISGRTGTSGTTTTNQTGVTITNVNAGGGAAHAIVQPTGIVQKLLRVL